VQERRIGTMMVHAIGLGEMPLSVQGRPDAEQGVRTIHAALDAGVTLIDTADAYCLGPEEVGHGERLVARALRSARSATTEALVATKGGHTRPSSAEWGLDGHPDYLRRAAEASATALGVSTLGLYQFHRPDPSVPYAESVGALADLLDAGTIAMAGISNATVAQIDEAQEVLGGRLAAVQNEFSPGFRSSLGELRHCAEHGIAFLPWSPLGGIGKAGALATSAFAEVAEAHDATPQQVVLAWMLAQGPQVIPIPGSSRPQTIRASAAAADLVLTSAEVRRLDAA